MQAVLTINILDIIKVAVKENGNCMEGIGVE